MQLYLNACDVVVLPYRSILNSAVAMLAFTFQRPVVAPRAGCLEELVEDDVGLTFDASGSDLTSVLLKSRELKEHGYRRAAFKKALEHPPAEMSKRFTDLLKGLR
jgi:beta-1,4-mannosyltransferase